MRIAITAAIQIWLLSPRNSLLAMSTKACGKPW